MKGVIENTIDKNHLHTICDMAHTAGGRMQMAYAWQRNATSAPEILYVASVGSHKPFQLWRAALDAEKIIPSLTNESPLLGWYEREMTDLYGIRFLNHPEATPLILNPRTPTLNNPQLQLLPFGPVRAGVCESAQFHFLYAGESILHFYETLFFKFRGMEQRFETLTPELGVILSERVSGVSSVAHALAFSQAVETACHIEIPHRAKQWRVILAECERLYNHLHYLGQLCHTTTLKVGEASGHILEEKLKQLNAKVTGSRFLRSIITPGGLRCEPDKTALQKTFSPLVHEISRYCKQLLKTNSHIERLMNTGVLTHQVAFDEGATGPVARASHHPIDFRIDYTYASYADFKFTAPIKETGDALARMQIRMQEIEDSVKIILHTLLTLSDTNIFSPYDPIAFAEGLGWAESPRGGLFYAVHFDGQGKLAHVKIKSPSFSNWRVFPFTVHETNMMDFAINAASFGSTIAGCDR